ncbi:unnamed protein product [Sympodiomycopsis kandeliae]
MQPGMQDNMSRASPSAPHTPAKELSVAAKRLSASGQSPIGSERGASPASAANKLAGSVSTLSSNLGFGPSDESLQAKDSSSRHSPASSTVPPYADDLTASGTLDPSDQEGIRARIERKRLEHERERTLQRQVFEEQMKQLELQQREEEATLMRQNDDGTSVPVPGPPTLSTPATPPGADAHSAFGSTFASANSPNHLGSGLSGNNDTEDGLNGSNVPGLAPLNSARSVPPTRPGSRDPSLNPVDARHRGGEHSDLTSSFGRISLSGGGSNPSPASANSQRNSSVPQASTGPGFQRMLSRTGVDMHQADSNHSGMTPVFNERFLFDDELDAEDSAFVKKYNLSGDDDKFPVLLRNDKFSETTGARGSQGADAHLSEWPQFEGRDRHADAEADRRGRSERNSPRGAASVGRPSPLNVPSSQATGAFARHGSIGPGSASGPFSSGTGLGSTFRGSPAPGANGPRRSVGANTSDRNSGFSAFSMDGPGGRLGSFPPGPFSATAGSDEANSSRPASGYFQAFGNGSGVNSAFGGFGAPPPEDVAQGEAANRKGELDVNTRLEDLKGEIFSLCKDQHGCRYLQKKLEDSVPSYRDMIFAETFSHFAELMTDPFGNYLCQKMLEFCTDEQRNLIVDSVSSELVTISLNMHGTRAVQKTIDFLSTPRQIHSIIGALGMNVVTLIKDLNGNHVIQKCLNRLGPEDNQFIYNAVAAHCVEVATHRHGCCVLQRCVDHASDKQRVQLVHEITFNALTLVQDPFGNYVVQYILDLNDARFTEAVVRQFVGNVCLLSVQKFSSNVIEKCIRVCDASTRRQLVEELLNRARLEKLLRDSFANYVVQTALDYSDPIQRGQLVDCIRPILPMIRNTPYGKRIQSKLQRETFDSNNMNSGAISYQMLQAAAHQQQLQAMAAMGQHPMDYRGMGMYGNAAGPGGAGGLPVSALPPPHQIYRGNPAGMGEVQFLNAPGAGGRGPAPPHLTHPHQSHAQGRLTPSNGGANGMSPMGSQQGHPGSRNASMYNGPTPSQNAGYDGYGSGMHGPAQHHGYRHGVGSVGYGQGVPY